METPIDAAEGGRTHVCGHPAGASKTKISSPPQRTAGGSRLLQDCFLLPLHPKTQNPKIRRGANATVRSLKPKRVS